MAGKRFTDRIQPTHGALWNRLITSVAAAPAVAGHDILKGSAAVVES